MATVYTDKYQSVAVAYSDKYPSSASEIYIVTPDLKKILVGALETKVLIAQNANSELYTEKYPPVS